MASKYDTNPLDQDFPEKARAAAEGATQTLPNHGSETRHFPPVAATEERTRRFPSPGQAMPNFSGENLPVYEGQTFVDGRASISRKVEKVGLPENVLTAVPYIPWYLGLVAGLLILFLVPKSEAKVRFHAAQGLAAHIGILIVTTVLGMIGTLTDIASIGNAIFTLATSIMLVIFAVKAWKGKPVHIESVDDLTNWLEEKIKPRK